MNAMYIHRIWDRVKDLETPWNRRTLQASSLDREWGAWWQGSAYSQLDQWRGTSHMGNSIASNCTSKEEDPTSVRVRTYIRICFHAKRCIYKAQWWLLCVAVWLHFLAEVGRLSTTGTRIFFFFFHLVDIYEVYTASWWTEQKHMSSFRMMVWIQTFD